MERARLAAPERDAAALPRGVLVPLVTPFRNDRIDTAALERLVDVLLERGVHGLVALGSTGEAPHLDDAERVAAVEAVVAAAGGRVPVFVGCGRDATRDTRRLLGRLARPGVQAALVLTPFYYRNAVTPAALRAHYAEVAAHAPIPVLVYHMPAVTGRDLTAETLAGCLDAPGVVGFKDSATQDGPLAATLRLRPGAAAYVGAGGRMLEGLEAGARGGILAVAHVVPELAVGLFEAWERGDAARAQRLQAALQRLAIAMRGRGVAAVKAGLALRGLDVGPPRRPLPPADPDCVSRLRVVLEAILAGAAPRSLA